MYVKHNVMLFAAVYRIGTRIRRFSTMELDRNPPLPHLVLFDRPFVSLHSYCFSPHDVLVSGSCNPLYTHTGPPIPSRNIILFASKITHLFWVSKFNLFPAHGHLPLSKTRTNNNNNNKKKMTARLLLTGDTATITSTDRAQCLPIVLPVSEHYRSLTHASTPQLVHMLSHQSRKRILLFLLYI